MQWILISFLILLTSCGSAGKFFDNAEHVLDDTAVKIEISREAVTADSDITTHVEIIHHKG